ncbi:hypothetical protein [Paenimyroides aestuarii]|uniref:Uncharacterized protein n=1 Tax=Paenimyroides aestuarii TaxID=2968490 RepID=A0ABY5NP02_9FLAO|nr:hypothetical protein [Paenimyroides aestuarii]UUV20266.1 hypothetical protein NPX36_07770 [Paenimyroides aestuarii]
MNKITHLFYFVFLICIAACSFTDEEQFVNPSIVVNNNHTAKPARTDWAFIAGQLVQSYTNNYSTTSNSTLAEKIVRLDSASMQVVLYNDLKPLNFSAPTTSEAQVFLTNYETAYNNLDVSVTMKSYLTAFLQENPNYDILLTTIERDILLTLTEKKQLRFIAMWLVDTTTPPEVDIWKKRKILAAVKGFEQSTANALFNVALVEIAKN